MASTVATVFLGLVASWIAIQQLRLVYHRFRLDLFDRRYKIFEATRKFLTVVWRTATFTDNDLWEFAAATADGVFLYPQEMTVYLHEIRKRALNQRLLRGQFERLPISEQRSALVEEEHEEFVWLTNQVEVLSSRFLPYLGFATIK